MHISDQIKTALINDGWNETEYGTFQRIISGFAEAGTISNGTRLVSLQFCNRSRYLSRIDGWLKVEKDIDLRDFENEPEKAIQAVLYG